MLFRSNLRHLDISGTNLIEMPLLMDKLKSLQTLTSFILGKKGGSISARTLVVCPIDLEYPLTQSPWQSLITPPPPALPRFPMEAPSEFNLNQPEEGLVQLTGKGILGETYLILLTQK